MAESKTYNVQVGNTDTTAGGYSTTNHYPIGDWWPDTITWPYGNLNWSYTYPVNHYLYQVTCPECKRPVWCEIDIIKVCSCGARIKATDKAPEPVPYEVRITK